MNIGMRKLVLSASVALLAFAGSSFADGFLKSLDLLAKIQPGATTAQEVRQLLGAPANVMHFPSQGYDAMQYGTYNRVVISIAIGADGKVRDVQTLRAPSF